MVNRARELPHDKALHRHRERIAGNSPPMPTLEPAGGISHGLGLGVMLGFRVRVRIRVRVRGRVRVRVIMYVH